MTCFVESELLYDAVVYDSGTLFDVAILDITDEDICSRFLEVTVRT